jgi:MFS family permease
MIGKIIPSKRHGSFFGTQAAVANMLSGIGAVSAGFILERLPSPQDFTLAFILTGVAMMISLAFLALTREHESEIEKTSQETSPFWSSVKFILRRDHNFRFFMLGRILFQFAAMAFAFYAIYGVNELGMSEVTAGLMAGVFSGVQIIANPILGGIGDRWGHQQAMIIGIIAATLSAFIAWWAPSATWFFVVFFLAGIANVSLWTISIAMSLRFGGLDKRPAYIGLTNTLVAPFTFLAPIIGGWLVDISGYALTFSLSGIVGIVALMMFVGFVRNPKP